ncbi:MAG: 6-bladed beta-propeller [Candidatus Aminicenantes bacterium]|nr:MAG: 6-bladed beta-propeller [Candidatus Aminicenantes bacterium]
MKKMNTRIFSFVLFLMISSGIFLSANSEADYIFLFEWRFSDTYFQTIGTALGSKGNLYVVDRFAHCIRKFDSNGNFITKWGSFGTGDGNFFSPWGIAIDSFDNVYVADSSNSRVQKFDTEGNFLLKWGSRGDEDGQFNTPTCVAVDRGGNVYVTDRYANHVQKFNSYGNFMKKFENPHGWNGQFNYPCGIGVSSDGFVYIADKLMDRILRFDTEGNFVNVWYGFRDPFALAIDSKDKVYVGEEYPRFRIFDSNMNLIFKLENWSYPTIGIAVDSLGFLYVNHWAGLFHKYVNPYQLTEKASEPIDEIVQVGKLSLDDAKPLYTKIDRAIEKLLKGNIKATCNQLQSLINQVNAYMNEGLLASEDGEILIQFFYDLIFHMSNRDF